MWTDAMFKLEHGVQDKGKGTEAKSDLATLTDAQAFHKDDFGLNQLARSKFRVSNAHALHF
jgi:coiled-coil domain-containing protein 130